MVHSTSDFHTLIAGLETHTDHEWHAEHDAELRESLPRMAPQGP